MAHTGQFLSGWLHPNSIDLRDRETELLGMELGTLRIEQGSLRRGNRSRQLVRATCEVCLRTREIHVDNILSGKTSNCTCQRGKYRDPRARTLGERYDAMKQRCERDTHVSSHHYKGRGIKVE